MSCPGADEIVDYLGARLSAERREAIAAHAADCARCRVALSELARATSPPSEASPSRLPARPGDSIGRYVIVERLGSGAMGVVYLAHDPQLDRRVAVKLLHQRLLVGGRERLLVEAQTLARISDPRVVTIFDADLHQDRPFVVMEHVRGVTLARWLAQARRPWRQVLARLVEAGRGLAAAHAAGITHGDFKPDNVLVGDDGRVRVTDFGLARWMAGEARALPAEGEGSSAGGTPAYMAPEQFAGRGGDALSDQFSFCVALYEGLFGARPFPGRNLDELVAAHAQPPSPPPWPLPRWLVRSLLRGLSPQPAARFPSLPALLDELEARLRRPRRLALAAAALALVAGVGLLVRNQLPQADRSCRIEARRLGDGWAPPPAVAASLRAAPGFAALDRALADYRADWVTVRVGSCEAAHATDAAARARFAARLACLDERRAQLLALVQSLSTPSDVPAATSRLAALPRPAACMTK